MERVGQMGLERHVAVLTFTCIKLIWGCVAGLAGRS